MVAACLSKKMRSRAMSRLPISRSIHPTAFCIKSWREVTSLSAKANVSLKSPRPLSYREVEGTTEEQTSDEPCQSGYLLHCSVAQATDEPDGEQHGDDDVNRLHQG